LKLMLIRISGPHMHIPAYSAPPDPVAGSGVGSPGRENWKEWKTGRRREREERGKGARRREGRDDNFFNCLLQTQKWQVNVNNTSTDFI